MKHSTVILLPINYFLMWVVTSHTVLIGICYSSCENRRELFHNYYGKVKTKK